MEPTSPTSDSPASLNGSGSRMERITGHAQGVVADLRRWVDLRIDLAVLDLETKLDQRLNAVAIGIIMAVFGGLAAFFTLVTVALGIGWLLGHPFWGFLIVTLALATVAIVVRKTQPTLVRTKLYQQWQKAKEEAELDAEDPDENGTVPSAPSTSSDAPVASPADTPVDASAKRAANDASSSASS